MPKQIKTALFSFLFVVIPLFVFFWLGLPPRFNLWIQEFFFRYHHRLASLPASADKIVLIGMDDESVQKLKVSVALPRRIIAEVLERIRPDDPKFVVLDYGIWSPSPYGPNDDEIMLIALQKMKQVILGVSYSSTGELLLPYSPYRKAISGVGSTMHRILPNGKIHDFPVIELNAKGEIVLFSFSAFAAFRYENIDLTQIRYEKNTLILPGREKINLAQRNLLPIFFFGRTEDFHHISFSDFYETGKDLPSFKDKIVIIGNDAPIFHDIYSTPLGELPGITIAANEVLTLLERKIIRPLDTFSNILIWLAAAAFSMWAAYQFSVHAACGLISVFIILFYAGSYLLFRNCVWIDFFTPVLVMVLSFLAVFFTRYLSLILEGARIKKLAVTDSLTDLLTFRYFRFVLEAKFEEAKKEKKDLSIAEFDIDFLRTMNDTQGREFGDQLLKKFSEILKDKAEDATIARYGGEEFIVMFDDVSSQETLKWVQSILENVRKNPLMSRDQTVSWTVSAGITSRKSSKAEKASRLIQFADAALVKAKRLGRDQAVLFDATAAFEDLQLVDEMQSQQSVPDTELGYLALDLEERNKELKDMADQLRKAFDEKVKTEKLAVAGELTARFSHEIKNPLANLKSCVEYLLAKPSKNTEDAEFLKMISQEVSRMTKLSLQMLRFFKPQEEGMVSCSINALIRDIYDISRRKFEGENVEVELSLDDKIPDVRVAPDQMKQVFLNLMMNALDAMRGKPGKVRIITSQPDSTRVQIRFEDTGPGVSEENKKKLFQSFFTTKKDGIGLGLSISYNIVKRHQGTLEVDPAYQSGAAFVIMIPRITPNI